MYLKLLALFTFLSTAFSQVITNVTYTDLLCASPSNTTALARGATAYLCVHFITYESSSKSYVPQRAVFPLTVDDFTSVQLEGGQTTFTSVGNFSQIVAQVQGIVQSTPLTYYQLANSFYSSAFSIVVQLDMGNITSVIWDHQCATCGSSECYAFTSGSTNIDSICNTPSCVTTNDSTTCDPQIFVTWIGSDINNVKMTSASMRLSRFRQFSTSELLSASTIPDFVPVTPAANSTNGTNSSTNTSTNTSSGDETDNEPNNNNPSSGNQNNGQNTTTNTSSGDDTDNESTNENNNPSSSGSESTSGQQNTQTGTGTETNGSGTETNGSGTETNGSGTQTGTGTETNGSGTETNGSGTQTGTGTETNGSGTETNGSGTETNGSGTQTGTGNNSTTTNTSNNGNGGTDQSDEEGSGQSQTPTPTVG